ncbi:MAG: methionine--tRNA ligase subunit beta, partial [Parabacteroides sp.]|nr:methionine--tRNA ligase subunit beta [Parabacteroides sp.]
NFGGFVSGTKVADATPLFARIDEAAKMAEIEEMNKEEETEVYEPLKEEISFDEFEKADFRVAKVISCEEVKKSEKLLKFELDLGFETRTILSGIKHWYKPDEMVGKNLVIIANLKPRKIMGIESKGMILSAFEGDNLTALPIVFSSPEHPLFPLHATKLPNVNKEAPFKKCLLLIMVYLFIFCQ